VDSQHNVLIVANEEISDQLRDIAKQSGIEFDDNNNKVFDFFNNQGTTDIITTRECHKKLSSCKTPILYRGLAMSLDDENELLLPILTGSKTSYSYSHEPIKSKPLVSGRKTVLVAGVQTRNSARITFVGSMDMLSNKYFETKSGNKDFTSDFTKWSFTEKGILRHRNVFHNKINTQEMPALYTVSEELEYQVIIEESVNGKWVPYVANDIQLELIMLDPYIRITLQHIKDGRYYTKFRAPDVYGVFKFVVNYNSQGFSHLFYSDEIVIRPFRINQFERFIPTAYPYYIALFSMMFGFFIFGVSFLYTKDKEHKD